ncbi:MAG TPA: hypothetical protein VFH58_14485 [Acidimicrobiales bacterium]|nr:hypothetical protein [Acidimicrobiales bacterium]
MDISDEQQSHPRLGLDGVMELMPVPSLLTDGSGVLTAANRAWTDLTGLDSKRSMGIGWMKVLHQNGRTSVLSAVRRTASDGLPLSLDTELLLRGCPVPTRFFLRGGPLGSEPVVVLSVVADAPRAPARPAPPTEHQLIEDADAVIRDLFSVGITLESCAEHLGAEVGLRLHDAVIQLDGAINRLRRAALYWAGPSWPGEMAREPVSVRARRHRPRYGRKETIERLLIEARLAVEMCERESPSSANEIEVVDSVQSLHRAIVGLAEAMEAPGPEGGAER